MTVVIADAARRIEIDGHRAGGTRDKCQHQRLPLDVAESSAGGRVGNLTDVTAGPLLLHHAVEGVEGQADSVERGGSAVSVPGVAVDIVVEQIPVVIVGGSEAAEGGHVVCRCLITGQEPLPASLLASL